MTSSRSLRMLQMAQEGQTAQMWEVMLADQMQTSLLPSYESTKGITSFEQELAIRGWQQLEKENIAAEVFRRTLENEITLMKQNGALENDKNFTATRGSVIGPDKKHVQVNKIESTENDENGQTINNDKKTIADQENCLEKAKVGIKSVTKSSEICKIEIDQHGKKLRDYGEETIENKRESVEDGEDYDSISEGKTSGSEYLPSDDEESDSYHLLVGNTGNTSTDDSDNYHEIEKNDKTKRKKQTKQIRKKIIPNSTTHVKQQSKTSTKLTHKLKIKRDIHIDPSEPSSSTYKPDTKRKIHLCDSESEKENIFSNSKEVIVNRPNAKIKIISSIQVKPPIKSINSTSILNADSTTAPADSTTETCSTQIATNLIKISAARKTTQGKRIRNKKHSCYYCHEMILHISRHMEVKHEKEMDVARALSFPKKSNKRKELFSEITRLGDFHHNCEVIALKQGELILVRRPTMNEINFNKYRDYGPCPKCLGFLLKKHLWHHLKTQCSKKDLTDQPEDPEQANRQVIAEKLPPIEEEEDDDLQGIANNENITKEASEIQNLSEAQKDVPEGGENNTDKGTDVDFLSKSRRNKLIKKETVKEINRVSKNPWNADDKRAVFAYFRVQIKNGIVPGKTDCEACQAEHTSLKNRKWTDIKFCVKNQITKIKKMKVD